MTTPNQPGEEVEAALKWFEKSGPYRLEWVQADSFKITGPDALDGHGPTATPRWFPLKEAEPICYWMNEAYAFGRRSSPVDELREALEAGIEQIGRCCYSTKNKNWHANGCATPKMKDALAASRIGKPSHKLSDKCDGISDRSK